MGKLRIATWNVEWFNALFDDHGRLWDDAERSARHGVTRAQQTAALARVFAALDADAVTVIEAPDQGSRRSTVTALEGFAKRFGLRARRAIIGFTSETEQEIALLYDPDRLSARHDPQATDKAPRFDGVFRFDIDADAAPEPIRFSKPPLELVLTVDGRELRLIGVHAKSKAPHGARTDAERIRISIDNRRKQLAECVWLRRRVVDHLAAGDSLLVMGDFNDGPGLDEFEKLFGQSGIEIVLGLDAAPALQLTDPHARMVLTQRLGVAPSTARFYLVEQERYFEALLDFIMLSPDLAPRAGWRIWHPFHDPACWNDPAMRDALLAASDHFPVTVDLVL
jgi:hypothetical protein